MSFEDFLEDFENEIEEDIEKLYYERCLDCGEPTKSFCPECKVYTCEDCMIDVERTIVVDGKKPMTINYLVCGYCSGALNEQV